MSGEVDIESRRYTSRREKNYEDGNSNDGDEDEVNSSYQDTGLIRYKDTKGNETVLKQNPKFNHYKSMFTNLLKQ